MFPETWYVPMFIFIGIGAMIISGVIIMRLIPMMAKSRHLRWHTTYLWLFFVGIGSLGLGIFSEFAMDAAIGRDFFLLADGAIVFGSMGMWITWEWRRWFSK